MNYPQIRLLEKIPQKNKNLDKNKKFLFSKTLFENDSENLTTTFSFKFKSSQPETRKEKKLDWSNLE